MCGVCVWCNNIWRCMCSLDLTCGAKTKVLEAPFPPGEEQIYRLLHCWQTGTCYERLVAAWQSAASSLSSRAAILSWSVGWMVGRRGEGGESVSTGVTVVAAATCDECGPEDKL